jgi:hypothetical protein
MLKFFNFLFFLKEQNFVKENQEYFWIYRNVLSFEMESSKLIQYTFVESALALRYTIYLPNKTPKKGNFYNWAGIKNEVRTH